MSEDEYARDLAKIRAHNEDDLELYPEALTDWQRKARLILLIVFSAAAFTALALNFLHF